MATPYKIVLGPKDIGNFHEGDYNSEISAKVSELLQLNLENWTIIFSGLRHNHIVHCILTMFSLGASVNELQKAYDRESSYQKPRYPIDEEVVKEMADNDKFKNYLNQQPHYSSFLLFFQREVEAKGVKATLEEHIFGDSAHASHLFSLLFNGIFHPYLHIGYAFEYNQPALVAEALAMASVHDPSGELMALIWIESEKVAGGPGKPGKKTLRELMEETRNNKTLQAAIDGENAIDRSKNVATNAPKEMIDYAAQYTVSDEQLEERMYEMIDTCSLLIAAEPPAIKEDQQRKIDFFLLHSVNTLVMMPTLINHEWISRKNAIRLVEWAGRCHLLNFVSQAKPLMNPVDVDEHPIDRGWKEIFDRGAAPTTIHLMMGITRSVCDRWRSVRRSCLEGMERKVTTKSNLALG